MTRVEHRSLKTGGKDDWETPGDLLEKIRSFRPIHLDPATSPDNPVRAEYFYTEADDGLSRSWLVPEAEIVFFNPPYSGTAKWLRKASDEWMDNDHLEIVALVGCRPCTKYWHSQIWSVARAVTFIAGRLKFVGATDPAPFESALVYWGNHGYEFHEHFKSVGHTVLV